MLELSFRVFARDANSPNLKDTDGLISTKYIKFDDNGLMYVEKERVKGINEITAIINILKNNPYLWSKSKFSLEPSPKGRMVCAGASIIGIPFSKALENIINGDIVQKSMFYIDDDLTNKGLEGRLIADYRKNNAKTEISFQLWEVLPLDLPTYFIHGIYNIKHQVFTHFDGALILHDKEIKDKMSWDAFIPPKNFPYKKLFRLDGKIPIESAMELMYNYLPLEDLNKEYGISPPIIEKVYKK